MIDDFIAEKKDQSAQDHIYGHFIHGKEITGTGQSQAVINPSNGEVIRYVELADQTTIEHAIYSAQQAFPAWQQTPPNRRAQIMFAFKKLLEENKQQLCTLIGQEHGKIEHDAMGEIQRGIEHVEFACGIGQLLKGEHSKNVGLNIDTWSEFHPLGVVTGITPFNFPAMVPLWMFPLAIMCGNCFILKPSEKVPSASLFLGKLLQQAGLPNGVFNVVNGNKNAVEQLITNPVVKAVSFVGSTAVAEHIYQQASQHGKRCQALGGAKNHAIILPDADLDNTTNQLIGAAFGSSGERCMALSVAVVVGEKVADTLVNKLVTAMQDLKVGAYCDSDNQFGPVISQAHQQKISAYIQNAAEQGASVVVDGRKIKVAGYENGFYMGGTLIDHVKPTMLSYQEEIFGPVLQIIRCTSMKEAIQLINAHQYGNSACIFTRDGEAARYFAEHVEVGMVGINTPLPVPAAPHSFGGWKRSLFGDLSIYGPDGVRFFTRRKSITQRWPSADLREGVLFSMPA